MKTTFWHQKYNIVAPVANGQNKPFCNPTSNRLFGLCKSIWGI